MYAAADIRAEAYTANDSLFIDFGCGCRHGDVHVQHFQGEASELDFGYLSEPDSWDSPDGTGITGALHIRITPFSAAILVLCLNAGAYLSEIFRSGIAAVNKGQMEAARSLGLPYGVAMRKIILPQAIRIVIPSVLNQFIITLKDTTILSVIGCGELMRQGQLIVARNYQSFQTYAIVAVMYYVVVIVLTKAFQLVERRLSNK